MNEKPNLNSANQMNNGGADASSLSLVNGTHSNDTMAQLNNQKANTPHGLRAEDYGRLNSRANDLKKMPTAGKTANSNNLSPLDQRRSLNNQNARNNINNMKMKAAHDFIKKNRQPVSEYGDRSASSDLTHAVMDRVLNKKSVARRVFDNVMSRGDDGVDKSKKPDYEKTIDEKSDEREQKKLQSGEINFELSLKTIKWLVILTPIFTSLLVIVTIVVAAINDDKTSSMILAGLVTTSEGRDYVKNQFPSNNSSSNDNSATDSDVEAKINDYLNESGASGTWAVYAKNLKNNSIVDINSSGQMVAASDIKLFIMEYLYSLVNEGNANESDFSSDVALMIQNSDNDATNRLIDNYGMSDINKYITSKYSQSKLQRKMLEAGAENYTSAKDIGTFLENVYNGNLISSNASSKMLGYLKNQTRTSKIPAGVPSGIVTANKTGELDTVENDAAIVYGSNSDYILVVLSSGLSDTAKARENIVKISDMVYHAFND